MQHLPSTAMTAVSTVLTRDEQLRVDAAGEGSYRTLHRETVGDVLRDLRANRAQAVIVSVACCDRIGSNGVTTMVREFPRIPTVALLSRVERATPATVLRLGYSGVQRIVDVSEPTGWRELRSMLLACQGEDIQRQALGQLALDLSGAADDCWRFFEALFAGSPRVSTVRALSRQLGVLPSTLMSRFFRAGVPAPKRYLATARLVRAARLFENPGFSIANVSNHLDYSSPQSFGRHVRTAMQLTALEFRTRYDGEGMLQHFRELLVLPYLDRLRRLRPLTAPVAWAAAARREL